MKLSLKDLYDEKMAKGLFWIGFSKWTSIVVIILGIGLVAFFNGSWIAIIIGSLLIIIGIVIAVIAHFIAKKLAVLIAMGGSLVENTENYMIDKAKQQFKKVTEEEKDDR